LLRQGDVLLVPVAAVPKQVERLSRDRGRLVLAEGEATGHAHALQGEAELVRVRRSGRVYLVVGGCAPAMLVHEEHDPIVVAQGLYEVRRQREYEPPVLARSVGWRRVAD
jgi:hypothetical protein